MMTQQQPMRRRPDGSIDTTYYCNRGRGLHAVAMGSMLKPRRVGIAAAIVVVTIAAITALSGGFPLGTAAAMVL